jgi:heptaprenyl diphosphate synthase
MLRQPEPDARAWSGMVLKYRIGDLLLDKLRECTRRIQLLLQDEVDQLGLDEFDAILEPYLTYLQPSHAAVRED